MVVLAALSRGLRVLLGVDFLFGLVRWTKVVSEGGIFSETDFERRWEQAGEGEAMGRRPGEEWIRLE